MIKIDKAYCRETDSVVSIYQVRDLHFDEDKPFHAKHSTYECADEDCQVPLVGVNNTKVKFKLAPHFRVKKGNEHSLACDFQKTKQSVKSISGVGRERELKDSEFPNILHLETKPITHGTGKPRKRREVTGSSEAPTCLNSGKVNGGAHETNSLEHVVETWLEHGKEKLSRVPLTINSQTWWYPNAFKPITWFYRDSPGRIYWGHVKQLKKYKQDYAITFVEKPYYQEKNRQVGIYIKEDQILGYRKRRLFRRYIDQLVGCKVGEVKCYFVGAYPKLKEESIESGEHSFRPLEVHLSSLDHIVLRFDSDGADFDE